MHRLSRRSFIDACASAAVFSLTGTSSRAQEADLTFGLQLFSIDGDLQRDFIGTLRAVRAIGYRAVEPVGYYGRSAADIRRAFADIGLSSPSIHIRPHQVFDGLPTLAEHPDIHLTMCRDLGARFLVAPGPWLPARVIRALPSDRTQQDTATAIARFTDADWAESAESLNECASSAREYGMQFLYHNGNREFADYGGETGYDKLLRLTDPGLVKLELDCGWVSAAGRDPIKYLREQRGRIPLVHIKDMRPTPPNTAMHMEPAELGTGVTNWQPLLDALALAHVEHAFVEQEGPYTRPPLESARINFEYLKAHGVSEGAGV